MIGDSHGNLVSLFERECTLAAAASEGDRGSAVADARSRPARGRVRRRAQGRRRGQLCRRRHHRIRLQRQGCVLHRDEHTAAGRASRDRTDHGNQSGRMAIAGGVRRKIAAGAAGNRIQRTRHRGPGLRGKSAEEFHAVGRPHQDLANAAGRGRPAHRCRLSRGRYGLALLRCDAGQGDRLGADASGRDRQAQSRAAGNRRPRRRHQYPVPVRAGDASGRARQCHRYRLHRARAEQPDGGIEPKPGELELGAAVATILADEKAAARQRCALTVANLWLDAGRPAATGVFLPSTGRGPSTR